MQKGGKFQKNKNKVLLKIVKLKKNYETKKSNVADLKIGVKREREKEKEWEKEKYCISKRKLKR